LRTAQAARSSARRASFAAAVQNTSESFPYICFPKRIAEAVKAAMKA
jgi:hypothetical protein